MYLSPSTNVTKCHHLYSINNKHLLVYTANNYSLTVWEAKILKPSVSGIGFKGLKWEASVPCLSPSLCNLTFLGLQKLFSLSLHIVFPPHISASVSKFPSPFFRMQTYWIMAHSHDLILTGSLAKPYFQIRSHL